MLSLRITVFHTHVFWITCSFFKTMIVVNGCSLTYSVLKLSAIHAFFISNTFIRNVRLKLAKNQEKAKQHTEAEILLFENYSLSSSTLSTKNNRRYSKKRTKNKNLCLNVVIWLITMEINRSRPRYGHKHTKYKMCLSIMMVICVKQHLKLNWG